MQMATIRRKKAEPFSILQRDPGPWPTLLINWMATLGIIVIFGLVMLFSASYTTGYLRFGDSLHFIRSQVLCLGLGVVAMALFSYIDYRFLRKLVWPGICSVWYCWCWCCSARRSTAVAAGSRSAALRCRYRRSPSLR